MSDPTLRFSGRVGDYAKHRPSYPPEALEILRRDCGLTPASVVADVGSGTGILSAMFLANGNRVHAVEPNLEMRTEAERLLGGRNGFLSVAGTAEETGLPPRSVDFVVAGQAFHWFDRDLARREFDRILKPGGWVMIVWNDRDNGASPFMSALEEIVRAYAIDRHQVDHAKVGDAEVGEFFRPGKVAKHTLSHHTELDRAGVLGLLLSASYMPGRDHPRYERMAADLNAMLTRFDERVRVVYTARMYVGRLRE